jgi:thiol-disulfide isomerase/thioredoxin
MQYYLTAPDHDLNFDVVVMYYATWCTNCKALSPMYSKIAEILDAGASESALVVAYFDCEASIEHAETCSTAGITHYPSILFYSLAGQHLSMKAPKHGTHFPGNWQQGEAILDWIRTMSFLAKWHRRGWGKRLRTLFFRNQQQNMEKPVLPVGIPETAAAERKVQAVELKVRQLRNESEQMRLLAVRSSAFLDAVLFPWPPGTDNVQPEMTDAHGGKFTDVFGYLTRSNGWYNTQSADAAVLRTCVMEAALDICERLSLQVTELWIKNQTMTDWETLSDAEWARISNETATAIYRKEPYCEIVETCVMQDYKPDGCRPLKCPFTDPTACRYLTACLTDTLHNEYAEAMGLVANNHSNAASSQVGSTPSDEKKPARDRKGWGFF